MQCVLTPADEFMPKTNAEIAAEVDQQVRLDTENALCESLDLSQGSTMKVLHSIPSQGCYIPILPPAMVFQEGMSSRLNNSMI